MRKDSEFIELGDTGMTLDNGVLKDSEGNELPKEPCDKCGKVHAVDKDCPKEEVLGAEDEFHH